MTSAHLLPHASQRNSVSRRVPWKVLSMTEMVASLQSGQMIGLRVNVATGIPKTEGV